VLGRRQGLAGEHRESSEEALDMVVGRGTHPLGGAMVRAEATVYGGVRRRRLDSVGRQRPWGAPAARDRRGRELRRTMGGRKMVGVALTGEVVMTAAVAWIPARSAALRRRCWTRGKRGKWGCRAGSGRGRKEVRGDSKGRAPVAF
jgi:uncharacterized membrane protein